MLAEIKPSTILGAAPNVLPAGGVPMVADNPSTRAFLEEIKPKVLNGGKVVVEGFIGDITRTGELIQERRLEEQEKKRKLNKMLT